MSSTTPPPPFNACSGEEKIPENFRNLKLFEHKANDGVARQGNGALGVLPAPCAHPLAHFQLGAPGFACLIVLHIISDTNVRDNSVKTWPAWSTRLGSSTVHVFNSECCAMGVFAVNTHSSELGHLKLRRHSQHFPLRILFF